MTKPVSIEVDMTIEVEVVCTCEEECGSSSLVRISGVEVINYEGGTFTWLVPWQIDPMVTTS